jgi:hypothetical protein
MKKLQINIPVKLLLSVMLLVVVSCKKSFFTEANINTNAPEPGSIVPSVMLSTVEGTLAYTQGGDLSRYASLITQQTLGFSRQAQGYYGYTFTSVDFDHVWGNFYTAVMENNLTLLRIADARNDNAYGGISRILMAYTLQLSVDTWGSIPYSDAFQGAAKLQSKFDNDKALYDTIANLLTRGIAMLSSPSPGPNIPGGEDVVYGGNPNQWIKFAHAVRARTYIHQAKGDAAMAANALAEIAQSFSSNADNAQYVFGSTETSANPWYEFNKQRGDINFDASTLGNQMKANNDPRYLIFTDTTFHDVNQVGMGHYYGDISSPVEFITYDELLFMKAEATLIASGNIASAQGFYRSAIQRNMEKLGVPAGSINTYIAANGTLPLSINAAIAKVSAGEFIALYLNPEAWALWRRNSSPALTPVVGTSVPRRLLYPQTEYSYNGVNIPASTTLFSPKVFWDK